MITTYFETNSNREISKFLASEIELIFDDVLSFQNNTETFVYFIFQRLLRLCDQKSFEKNQRR